MRIFTLGLVPFAGSLGLLQFKSSQHRQPLRSHPLPSPFISSNPFTSGLISSHLIPFRAALSNPIRI